MDKLKEDSVWLYSDESRKYYNDEIVMTYHHFICNFGSKSNFLKLIRSVRFVSGNWVKDRITESGNKIHVKLSKKNPNCFIYFTSKKHWTDDDYEIVKILKKTDPIGPPL